MTFNISFIRVTSKSNTLGVICLNVIYFLFHFYKKTSAYEETMWTMLLKTRKSRTNYLLEHSTFPIPEHCCVSVNSGAAITSA